MCRMIAVPSASLRQVQELVRRTGWEMEAGTDDDLAGALSAGAEGRAVLFVPEGARVSDRLRRIVVLHDGSPGVMSGVQLAEAAAAATGAGVVVLHVLSLEPPVEPGSLPAPGVLDEPCHAWKEWRQEFETRFCRAPAGSPRLEVSSGPVSEAAVEAARRLRADLMVMAWKGEPGPGRARTVKAMIHAAPCPVLLVRRWPVLPVEGLDAVIFDLDGVLTDTASLHAAAWKRLFDGFLRRHAERTGTAFVAFDADEDYRRHVDGKPRRDGVRDFLASRGITVPEYGPAGGDAVDSVAELAQRKDAYFLAELDRSGPRPYPATVAAVRALRSLGIAVAVVSASRHLVQVLDRAGLADLFDVVLGGDEAARLALPGKPDPAVFLQAVQRLGAAPERTAVVEDALAGVRAGRRGGFGLVVGVDRTGHAADMRRAGAHVVVPDLGDLEIPSGRPTTVPHPAPGRALWT